MLLYVFKDGTVKQVEDNPTTIDYIGVASGVLKIIKFDGRRFIYLLRDEATMRWVPVKQAQTISGKAGRLHQ